MKDVQNEQTVYSTSIVYTALQFILLVHHTCTVSVSFPYCSERYLCTITIGKWMYRNETQNVIIRGMDVLWIRLPAPDVNRRVNIVTQENKNFYCFLMSYFIITYLSSVMLFYKRLYLKLYCELHNDRVYSEPGSVLWELSAQGEADRL